MLVPSLPRLPPTNVPLLLVLLPLVAAEVAQQVRTATRTMLDTLQQRLGTPIQLLVVDEANDPDVVRSFRLPALPAFLLMRQGAELWRQPGLPEGELLMEELFQRVNSPA